MVAVSERQYLTPQEYLDWEAQQSIKYEYEDVMLEAVEE